MELPRIKIPIFSEKPADFQEWKIDFITGIGLRKLRQLIAETNPIPCPPVVKPDATEQERTQWEKHVGPKYNKWRMEAEEIFHILCSCVGRTNAAFIHSKVTDFDGVKA